MYKLLPILIFIGACAPVGGDPVTGVGAINEAQLAAYASQTSAPSPDYRAMLQKEGRPAREALTREATATPPHDARAVGDLWLARLHERNALLGHGLSSEKPDAAVSVIDTGLTIDDFDRWTRANGWPVPRHIRWGFVSALKLPEVSAAADGKVRVWPASTVRTGLQLQALHSGRVELRDGCFFTGAPGQPADKLAWFHAEIGLDIDPDGYYILRDRVDGATLARLGEEMNWAGPASATMDDDRKRVLRDACGPAEIMVVGSPQSRVRFHAQYPNAP